jgi:hypothetical protein
LVIRSALSAVQSTRPQIECYGDGLKLTAAALSPAVGAVAMGCCDWCLVSFWVLNGDFDGAAVAMSVERHGYTR